MNKMMKLLLVAEGCTLATMACEPGHWYVGGGVGVTYNAVRIKPQFRKYQMGDMIGETRIGVEAGDIRPELAESERDAINDALTRVRAKKFSPHIEFVVGRAVTTGKVMSGIEASLGLEKARLRLFTGHEVPNGREEEQVNPPSQCGTVSQSLRMNIRAIMGLQLSHGYDLMTRLGLEINRFTIRARNSLDNGLEDALPKLREAYNQHTTCHRVRARISIGCGLRMQLSSNMKLQIAYDWIVPTNIRPAKGSMVQSTPKFRIRTHRIGLQLHKII